MSENNCTFKRIGQYFCDQCEIRWIIQRKWFTWNDATAEEGRTGNTCHDGHVIAQYVILFNGKQSN
jgi:hypothetical protein